MNLNLLKKIASKSTHSRNNHAVIILKGNRILSTGYNHGDIHAEIMAIKRASRANEGNRKFSKNSLYNATLISFMSRRITSTIGVSRPCGNCLRAITLEGIRRVIYFDGRDFVSRILSINK